MHKISYFYRLQDPFPLFGKFLQHVLHIVFSLMSSPNVCLILKPYGAILNIEEVAYFKVRGITQDFVI